MFEIVLNNKKSKYRDKPVMNIDVNDPCSWEEVKDKVMYEALQKKFSISELKEKLLNTIKSRVVTLNFNDLTDD